MEIYNIDMTDGYRYQFDNWDISNYKNNENNYGDFAQYNNISFSLPWFLFDDLGTNSFYIRVQVRENDRNSFAIDTKHININNLLTECIYNEDGIEKSLKMQDGPVNFELNISYKISCDQFFFNGINVGVNPELNDPFKLFAEFRSLIEYWLNY